MLPGCPNLLELIILYFNGLNDIYDIMILQYRDTVISCIHSIMRL
jgi:hypothetical protein